MTYAQVCTMDRWELAHWIAKLRLDPPVVDAMTALAAMLGSVQANTAMGSTGEARPQDFLIDWRAEAPTEQERMLREADAWQRWAAMAQAANQQE